jgi:hypothetical protein
MAYKTVEQSLDSANNLNMNLLIKNCICSIRLVSSQWHKKSADMVIWAMFGER